MRWKNKKNKKIRGNCILEMIKCNSYIAIFSPPISSELFHVSGVADQTPEDEFNHAIPVGAK